MRTEDDYIEDATQLLISLVQNKCINPPGNEMKSIKTIEKHLKDRNIPCQVFETAPNRGNLIAEIKGTGERPSLMFGPSHVDVVPIGNQSAWKVDPFAGIIKDNQVWGRGTTDMLFIVVTQVQAFIRLYEEGFKPKGDLRLCLVADEEVGGTFGTKWLMDNQSDFMKVDYAVSEAGGIPIAPDRLLLVIGEKGSIGTRIFFKGTPIHGAMPYNSDNAVIKASIAAERLARYNPPLRFEYLKYLSKSMGLNFVTRIMLNNKFLLPIALKTAYKQNPSMGRLLHALSRMTISPNMIKGGNKKNVVAGEAYLDVDIRTLPDQDEEYVTKQLRKAMGSLGPEAIIDPLSADGESFSSIGTASNPESEILPYMREAVKEFFPNVTFVPLVMPGATDMRFLRPNGTQAYGFSLFPPETPMNTMVEFPHGPNERISLKTIEYTFKAYYNLAKKFLE